MLANNARIDDGMVANPYYPINANLNEVTPDATTRHASVIVIGGGFTGIAVATLLKRRGIHDFLILDRNDGFGGCWRDNTYPGVACDVPSHLYSLSFNPNPNWSRVYSPGGEIKAYLENTAEKEGLLAHYRPNTSLEGAYWQADKNQWRIETTQGEYTAQFLLTATGHLVDPKLPEFDGMDGFEGAILHSARWDHSIDLTGKRIAVIGTGASAIQVFPEMAKIGSQVTIFQRTPAWIIPRPDRPFTEAEKRQFARHPESMQTERANLFWHAEQKYGLMRQDPNIISMTTATANKHREIVADPVVREKLTPKYAPGCKRILVSNNYFPTFNQDNVHLEDSALSHFEGNTLVAKSGARYEVDAVVFCTGFDVSEPVYAKKVFNADGKSLSDVWGQGGVPVQTLYEQDFPNLIVVNARNTGLGHNSLVYVIESQAAAVADAITWAKQNQVATFSVKEQPRRDWEENLKRMTEGTVWVANGGCGAWYIDQRTGNLTALWPSLAYDFRSQVQGFDPEQFEISYQ